MTAPSVLSKLLPWGKPGLYRANVAATGDVAGSCSAEMLMLYMVIERFKNRGATPVYRRFREKGRMTPEGLNYMEIKMRTADLKWPATILIGQAAGRARARS